MVLARWDPHTTGPAAVKRTFEARAAAANSQLVLASCAPDPVSSVLFPFGPHHQAPGIAGVDAFEVGYASANAEDARATGGPWASLFSVGIGARRRLTG